MIRVNADSSSGVPQCKAFRADSAGFERCAFDPCLYSLPPAPGATLARAWLAITVDDFGLASESRALADSIAQKLAKLWTMTCAGFPSRYLGMDVERDASGAIRLSCSTYIREILARFGMSNANASHTPRLTSVVLQARKDDEQPADVTEYRELIGALTYAAACCRPDIAYAVNSLAQHNSNPGPQHTAQAKCVLRYLAGTASLGILFTGKPASSHTPPGLVVYVDADFAASVSDRKSTSGYVMLLHGSPVLWKSKKQTCTALSTTESELVAASAAAQDAIWVLSMLEQVHAIHKPRPVPVFEDNQSTIAVLSSPHADLSKRLKHVDIRYFCMRKCVADGLLRVIHVPGEKQVADLLTKALCRATASSCFAGC